jgi:hypothetical protein
VPIVETCKFNNLEISLMVCPVKSKETISNSLGESWLNGLLGVSEIDSSASMAASVSLMYLRLFKTRSLF